VKETRRDVTPGVDQEIRRQKIVAIVRGADAEDAMRICSALYEGGIRLVEVTCNSPGFEGTISRIGAELPEDARVGAGTVVSVDLAKVVLEAGAEYVLAPDTNAEVVRYCLDRGVPVIPGAATPTEILRAQSLGAPMIKLFPAAALGEEYVRQIKGPLDGVDLLAVGGITADNAAAFVCAGCVGVGMGGGLVRKDLVAAGRWSDLRDHARRVLDSLR